MVRSLMYALRRASIRPASVVATSSAIVAPMMVKRATRPGRRMCEAPAATVRLMAVMTEFCRPSGGDRSSTTVLDIARSPTLATN